MKKLGIYIHIPFCVSKCNYCAFNSDYADIATQKVYINTLIKEIQRTNNDKSVVDSIYFGGGTPSFLYSGGLDSVLNELYKRFKLSDDVSITAEGNPESLSKSKLQEWKSCGINRLSIGLQSADNTVLQLAGRKHTSQMFDRVLNLASQYGFGDISCDIMLGLKGDTMDGVSRTLTNIFQSGVITHVSAYGLTPEKDTPWADYKVDEDLSADMYDMATERLQQSGFWRYEVSNFAKENYQSRHNLKYWRRENYLGFGVGAHSMVDDVRSYNPDDMASYIKGERVITPLTTHDIEKEYIMLNLRLTKGFDLSEYSSAFGQDFLTKYKAEIASLIQHNLLIIENGYIKVHPDKFGVLNSILVKFF